MNQIDNTTTPTLEEEIIEKHKEDLVVPDRLSNPDKLIVAAKKTLDSNKYYGYNGGLISSSRGELTIRATKGNISRALRFMDAFIKVMRKRGHEVVIRNDESYAVIRGEEFLINCREKLKRVESETKSTWQTYDYTATGILTFNAKIHFSNVEWKDGKEPIEKQLAKIIARLELSAEEYNQQRIEREKYWAERKEKERIIQAERDKKAKEVSDFRALLQNATQWREAKMLREYLDTIEQKATVENNLSDELKNWLQWARKRTDAYDPLVPVKKDALVDS
ncbi:MAG: hypothetical protein AABZ32_05690 [Bacteroidota bacterium]